MNPSVMLPMTWAVSLNDSLTPSWISAEPRNIARPPSTSVAVSLATRVRVERLLNIRAMVLPASECLTWAGENALQTYLYDKDETRSPAIWSGERSASVMRCRGVYAAFGFLG